MPIHDWTRVSAGTFHAFHLSWISEIQLALNGGVLPSTYYAQAESIPDPKQLIELLDPRPDAVVDNVQDSVTFNSPPRLRFQAAIGFNEYVLKQSTLVVRQVSDDRIIALIELISPGNKSTGHDYHGFIEKAAETLRRRIQLLVVDLFPPGRCDPQRVHGGIWQKFSDTQPELPVTEPLTLTAYSAGNKWNAYIEPTAVGRELIDMPLFLEPEIYVNVPLEATYQAAYRGVPQRWKQVLD